VKTPPSKGDFAKLMMDRIRQTGEKGKIVYQPEDFCLRGEGKRFAAMFLANAYQEYCAADSDLRDRVIKQYVRNWFATAKEMPEEFEDVRPDLLPVVRSRAHFELNNLESGIPLGLPYEVLGEHFGVGIVYDLPEAMRSIPQASFDAWGVTFYEALEAAMGNLLSLPGKFICPESGEGVYLSATGDNYDSSRLLITDAIRHFQVKGDHIAMIPNRENLIVAGSEDVEGLAGMAKMASMALGEPRPISGLALRLEGDGWIPWLPPPSHPSYKDFRQLQIRTLSHEYSEQKELLDKLYAKNGEGVFVATYSVIQHRHSGQFGYAIWSPQISRALLPKTDVLVFGGLEGEPTMVEWQKVVDVAGDLMEAVDIYPPRYRVKGFPSDEQLAAMGDMLE